REGERERERGREREREKLRERETHKSAGSVSLLGMHCSPVMQGNMAVSVCTSPASGGDCQLCVCLCGGVCVCVCGPPQVYHNSEDHHAPEWGSKELAVFLRGVPLRGTPRQGPVHYLPALRPAAV